MNKRVVRGLTASAALAGAVAAGATLAAPANAVALPSVSKTKSLPEGSVTIKLYGESARIGRAVTSTPLSREVFVSGKVSVKTTGGVKGGSVNAGYIVGCQVNFGADMGATGKITGSIPDQTVTLDPKAFGGTGGIKLSPGKAVYTPVIHSVVDDYETNAFTFKNAQGGVAYSNERFGVDGCAGYAQARAKVTVRVSTDTYVGNVTLYGKPFSIG
ncbi:MULTISPECIES: MspA family porin [Gordonia]|uniref:MspA n=1 Tax=Gordonia cholesterolivorans TaxID=559625 RepID=A0ABN3H080_9ACTN|nr:MULTISPECIES: MspA family porin [Gordonia]KJR06943.1 membrane protein [Gordonia sihwensis]KXT56480.1 membrane protein [Gordonia sp. QH-12]WFN93593.1 MspA family porin [Gordonia sihwensis]